MAKLEIGSGTNPHPGYEHLDINPDLPDIDIIASMDSIPKDNDTYEEILSVHSIEHIEWGKIKGVLKEWVRVLKPGGRINIYTPNFNFIATSFLEGRSRVEANWMRDYGVMTPGEQERLQINGRPSYGLWMNFKVMSGQGQPYDYHMAMYDDITLGQLLLEAGCSTIESSYDGDYLRVTAVK